ncbi:ABC transporter substrate-binding protein [Roseomonas sp. NAR14]|uniref:ABC transporter substrate-binding protein n=1 Tax=Roseomonas acroporae TaxID=2937791 RepID=A0A9X1Y9H6_9PROT|nr:ABC transporter substrate-binding protein [Roseomonas acroporae]MCK8786619.1 ABC transporter substrate-binding protein [Roseomonas acroporae]
MRRRSVLGGLAATPLAAMPGTPALAQGAAARTLRVVPQANLTSLDPVWTTAVVTRVHAYMVYDQLVAMDEGFTPRPQMVEGWTTEDDGKRWVFTLREGLRFHDGEKVLARDCVASIRRWWVRDTVAQLLAARTDSLTALDDRRFELRLKLPFPTLLAALGKASPSPLFIMPARLAATDPFQQVADPTGSGPFRFLRDEWNPGSRAVWARFDGYVPRQEPVSGTAGGKQARVSRVEWSIQTDPATAANALIAGEQDYWEYPLHDLLPLLRGSRGVVVAQRLSQGTYGCLRMNHIQPPFDDPAVRRALAMAVDQRDYLRAVAGDEPGGWEVCEGFYTCHSPLATEAGNAILRTRSVERGRAALARTGYRGEKVVLMAPADYPQINALSLVTADLLQRLGFNLELVSTDWGTVIQRRVSREPVERGGWSVIHTTWAGSDVLNPAIHQYVRANGRNAWFGWPDDPTIERLRSEWFDAPDAAAQKQLAEAIQLRAFEVLPYVPLGFYWQPSAWRQNVTGTFRAPITAYWNVGKG